MGADRDAGHRGEPSVERAKDVHRERTAPLAQKNTVGRERLNAVVVAVGHVNCAVARQGHVRGIIKLAAADPDLASGPPLAHEATVGAKPLDALVKEVGDEQIAVIGHGDAAGRVELSRPAALAADGPLGRSVEAKDLDAVVPVVRDVKLAAVDGQVHRPAEPASAVAAEFPLEVAVEVEHLDAPVARVAHEHLAAGHGDAGGVAELAGAGSALAPGSDEDVARLLCPGNERKPASNEKHHRGRQNDARPSANRPKFQRSSTRQKLNRKPARTM